MISHDEALQIKTDIEVLKTSTKQCLQATTRSAEASAKVADQISNLLIEMKERDVREEYRTKEITELKESVIVVDSRIAKFIESETPTLTRSKARHLTIDEIKKGFSSTMGKFLLLAAVAGIMFSIGLDPRGMFE